MKNIDKLQIIPRGQSRTGNRVEHLYKQITHVTKIIGAPARHSFFSLNNKFIFF
jgi:hypothetical protein